MLQNFIQLLEYPVKNPRYDKIFYWRFVDFEVTQSTMSRPWVTIEVSMGHSTMLIEITPLTQSGARKQRCFIKIYKILKNLLKLGTKIFFYLDHDLL